MVLAAGNQDWVTGHRRRTGVAALLGVLGAALKTFPTLSGTSA